MEHGLMELSDILSSLEIERRGDYFYTLLEQSQLAELPLFYSHVHNQPATPGDPESPSGTSGDESPTQTPGHESPSEIPEMGVLAIVTETEGITAIISSDYAQQFHAADEPVFTCLTLNVHSGLESIGLTKTVSTLLADNGIACNVIAGFYHDHLLVPAERADDAVQLLQALTHTGGHRAQ